MKKDDQTVHWSEKLARKKRHEEIVHLQMLEGNPLDAEDEAMFAMFEREGWSDERCRAYIREQALKDAAPQAAE